MRGFNTWQISISAVESNLAFLLLPWKIEILTIEEKHSIFFSFSAQKSVAANYGRVALWKIKTIFLSIAESSSCTNIPESKRWTDFFLFSFY